MSPPLFFNKRKTVTKSTFLLLTPEPGHCWVLRGPECFLSEGGWPTVAAGVGTEPRVEGTPVKACGSQGRVLVSTAWVTMGFGYRLALLGTADERGGAHPCFFWWEEGKGAVGGVPWVVAEEGKLGLRPGIGSCSSDGGDLNEVGCYRRRTQMTIRGHWVLRSSAPSTR